MWNRKRTRKSEQTDYTQDNSSHYWQLTVNLSWLLLLIQAFHSNSNVDKHINTRKLSIKQSPLSRPFYLTCTNLMRHGKKKYFQQKINKSWQFTGEAAQYYVESSHSDILRWISKRENGEKYILGWAMVMLVFRNKKVNHWNVSWCQTVPQNKKDKEPNSSDTKGTPVNTAE